jgi:uncharacterized repeat protein (TIGR01451 family)
MGRTRYSGRERGRSSRFGIIALLLGLALIVSQAIGVVTAAADGSGPSGLTSIGSGSTEISTNDSTTKSGGSSRSSDASSSAQTSGSSQTSATDGSAPSTTTNSKRTQSAAAATDPAHVSETLEGCRGSVSSGSYVVGGAAFICSDGEYTTGNLGKGWAELDLVPHRLTTELGSQDSATTDYTLIVAADNSRLGYEGFDYISELVVNDAKSDDSCSVSSGPQGEQAGVTGGVDDAIYRVVTIHQAKGTTCVFDYVERLSITSAEYSGSSLQSYMFEKSDFSTGKRTVPLPVKEILPQELSKTETATLTSTNGWSIHKSASPASVDFGDTCAAQAPASKTVDITVSWSKTVNAEGNIVVDAAITATNPAHREIDISVTDTIYEGGIGSSTVATALVGQNPKTFAETVGAGASKTVHHVIEVAAGSATVFSDKAVATYIDKLTGIPVPGTNETTAEAAVQTVADDSNSSVVINDVESITGAGLSFSVGSTTGASGSFDGGYTEGDVALPGDEVSWTSDPQTTDGSVTFHKTIYFDGPGKTSGSLDDTAKVIGDGETVLDTANASVDITADATLSLTIDKSVPAGSVSGTQDFVFDVTGPNAFSKTVTLTFDGSSNTESATFSVPEEGTYSVTEQTADGWQPQLSRSVVISLADCTGTASFANVPVEKGSITIVKDAQPDDPQDFGFTGDLGSFSLDDDADVTLPNSSSFGDLEAGSYAVTENATTGWTLADITCNTGEGQSTATRDGNAITISLAEGEDVTCTFTNTKDQTPPPPPPPAPLGIQIIKSGPALAHVGDTITYTFDVSLTTATPLTNITVTDPICTAAPALGSKSGGDQDAWLETGETWRYSCTHQVSASDPDPLPNTATVSGTDGSGRNTSDTDDHLVDIIHPAIKIVKTANPLSISPGETVTYTYKVTNVGDVTLYNVSVDDDKLGHICDIAQLAVDETRTCTKDFTAGEGNLGPLKNVAVAAGEDETGYPVRDDDKASIAVVLGTTVTPTSTPPSGTAFTGSSVLPLGAIALVLLIVGSGLIYMGRRREDGSQA